MYRIIVKALVIFGALMTGIGAVWIIGLGRHEYNPIDESALSRDVSLIDVPRTPSSDEAGKLVIRFKGFEQRKDWVAIFEIVNYSKDAVMYIGEKSAYRSTVCTLTAQREVMSETTGVLEHHFGSHFNDGCQFYTNVGLQSLLPEESLEVSVDKYEVQPLVDIRSLKSAQIGFEFFVGEKKIRRMFWSEEITFPED
jgi:hypothetical protein